MDYTLKEEIIVVYELFDHISSRLRGVGAAAQYRYQSDTAKQKASGFSHSLPLPEAANISKRIYES